MNIIDCVLVSIQPTHALACEKRRRMPKTFKLKRKKCCKKEKESAPDGIRARAGKDLAIERLVPWTIRPQEQLVLNDDLKIPIPLCAQCDFSGAFSGVVSSPYTEHESVFFGPDPCMWPAVKRETKKRAVLVANFSLNRVVY